MSLFVPISSFLVTFSYNNVQRGAESTRCKFPTRRYWHKMIYLHVILQLREGTVSKVRSIINLTSRHNALEDPSTSQQVKWIIVQQKPADAPTRRSDMHTRTFTFGHETNGRGNDGGQLDGLTVYNIHLYMWATWVLVVKEMKAPATVGSTGSINHRHPKVKIRAP